MMGRELCSTFHNLPSGGLFEEQPLSDNGFLPRSLENRNFRHTEVNACFDVQAQASQIDV